MRQNVDPKLWGSAAWTFLRHCAAACDESCGASYKSFLGLLPEVLPCEQCREHSSAYIAANPVDTGDLVGWVERFRQAVARRKASEGRPAAPVAASSSPGCPGCAGAAKLRTVLLVLGAVVACVALVLLVVGLVKLTKASRIK